MRLDTEAVIVAVRNHGEYSAIVRALTPDAGIQPGYVRGGKSRRQRSVLVPGNRIHAAYRARTDEQLAYLTAELAHSRAFLFAEPLAAAGIEWACALTATVLPDGQPYPRLFQGLDGLLSAIEAAPSARGWAGALVRYESLVLHEAGFGFDEPDESTRPGGWPAIHFGLARTGRLLARDLLFDRQARVLAARERLIDRLERMAG